MENEFDIIIAGGGIAGLSAGAAAARLGHSVLILTGDVLGGHLLSIEKIEDYPDHPDGIAGYELCPTIKMQAGEGGAQCARDEVTGMEQADGGGNVATAAES